MLINTPKFLKYFFPSLVWRKETSKKKIWLTFDDGPSEETTPFILNILKCKTPDNRDPLPSEVGKCDPYLQKQIKIIKPKLIVALGKIAGKNLIKKDIPLNDMRENTFDYYGKPLRVTYHPTALLRNQSLKKLAWDDFQWIKEYMKKVNG